MLDSVSLAPVLLGKRGDDQPVRANAADPEQPRPRCVHRGHRPAEPPADGEAEGGRPGKMTAQDRKKAKNKAWNQIAKKGAKSGSDGMAHALREGPWKLVFDIEHDKPAALYNLPTTSPSRRTSSPIPAHAARVKAMEKLYRDIRASKRSTPAAGS